MIVRIGDNKFAIDVVYDVYPGEVISEVQKETVCKFNEIAGNALKDTEVLFEKFKISKFKIDKKMENIVPKMLYVGNKKGKRVISILCDYKYDEEHGLAICFENEILKMICLQDDVL